MEIDDFSWLVGLIEGEGSFTFHQRTVRFHVGSVDQDVIVKVGQLLSTKVYSRSIKSGKEFYFIHLTGRRAEALGIMIHPHMSQRRQKQIFSCLTTTHSKSMQEFFKK